MYVCLEHLDIKHTPGELSRKGRPVPACPPQLSKQQPHAGTCQPERPCGPQALTQQCPTPLPAGYPEVPCPGV